MEIHFPFYFNDNIVLEKVFVCSQDKQNYLNNNYHIKFTKFLLNHPVHKTVCLQIHSQCSTTHKPAEVTLFKFTLPQRKNREVSNPVNKQSIPTEV